MEGKGGDPQRVGWHPMFQILKKYPEGGRQGRKKGQVGRGIVWKVERGQWEKRKQNGMGGEISPPRSKSRHL